jgi:HD superfamily phosphodiesterase
VIKPDEAREIARGLLVAELPRRWAHTEGVAACARSLGPVLAEEADLIEVAAWFHDIGYAEALA